MNPTQTEQRSTSLVKMTLYSEAPVIYMYMLYKIHVQRDTLVNLNILVL